MKALGRPSGGFGCSFLPISLSFGIRNTESGRTRLHTRARTLNGAREKGVCSSALVLEPCYTNRSPILFTPLSLPFLLAIFPSIALPFLQHTWDILTKAPHRRNPTIIYNSSSHNIPNSRPGQQTIGVVARPPGPSRAHPPPRSHPSWRRPNEEGIHRSNLRKRRRLMNERASSRFEYLFRPPNPYTEQHDTCLLHTNMAISSLDISVQIRTPNCPCGALKHASYGQLRPALEMTALTLRHPTQPPPPRRTTPSAVSVSAPAGSWPNLVTTNCNPIATVGGQSGCDGGGG